MGFLDTDTVLEEVFHLSSSLESLGSMVDSDMVMYTKQAAENFYGSYSPRRYKRVGDLRDVGEPLPHSMIGKYGVRAGAQALEGKVSGKPAYQWGNNPNTGMIVSGEEIFNSAWMGGRHGAWYTAVTTASPESKMDTFMNVEQGKIGGYLDALLG